MYLALLLALVLGAFFVMNWAPEKPVAALMKRWAPPPSIFVNAGGMSVHLRDEGPRDDPSPIVLLHGTGSSLHAWDGWAELLKDQRRIIRYDLAGFGLTGPSPDGVYTITRDVGLLIAILDKLGIAHCVLGGNSLGGAVAWRAALAHPARVEKLILVDAGGYNTRSVSVPLGLRLARMPGVNLLLSNTLPRFLVEQGFRNVFGDPRKVTREMVDRSIALMQREGNRRALIARIEQTERKSLAHRIPELKQAALIMWGGRDRLIPPRDALRFHRDISRSTLALFDDLGHAPEEEDPVATASAVKHFLGLK
jgi:pimeloyl-ACP methyl ester carboxylesterase